ncbi:thiamine phosphate synthase [Campylobacter insulaenigrae]|uniref:thiamine phosphate synthase n=1 Tax=Campylobacter insulaenigrae TaxID=260714 RepID=UPI00215201C4|nr:thiamine phosphate synthase [Campylobacter insulaenigrae]MCR6575634.1 thiamine phosphate synthase [Campylobacter insulaenigrae]
MWAKKIVAISDSQILNEDFLIYIEKLTKAKIDTLVLREKHLSDVEYYDLAKEVLKICKKNNTNCVLHNFDRISLKLNHKFFHAPLNLLRNNPRLYKYFHILGTSIHSKEELYEAMMYKVNYAFVGHIFDSSCKIDLPPYGLELMKELLTISKIPLYAIGGINLQNINKFQDLDIAGVCMREAFVHQKNLRHYINECKNILNP